ncbi:MAG: FtsX-like permease family protein [Huintestinicola sp.]|uniref:ABC transporter permease n=1 Tax=Huintestinicola sp. TaxID=2981661 RepID=UPI003F097D39
MEILTLLRANIRHKKGAFISVILLMMIITLSFSVTVSNNDNVSDGIERAHKAADTGDLAAFVAESELDDNILNALSENENTERIRDERALAVLSYKIGDRRGNSPYFLLKWENSLPVYDANLMEFEAAPEALSEGEVYVPAAMKTVYGCEIGSEITVTTKNGEKIFAVKGFVEDPAFGSMSIGIKQLFISDRDFERLYSEDTDDENAALSLLFPCRIIHIFQAENSVLSITELKKELNRECLIVDISLFTQSRESSDEITTIFTDTGTKMLYVFVILLVVIVMIAINHSIVTTIETEYVSLGILKAQGFTENRIRLIYIIQYFCALAIGGVIGIASSFPLTKILGKLFQPITGIMVSTNISVGKCLLVTLGIILICTVYIIIASKKIGRISPVRAISGGAEEIYFDSPANIPIKKKPLSFFIALRQITSHPKAYIGTALIAALLIFFMATISILAGGMSANSMIEALGALNGQAQAKPNNHFELSDMSGTEAGIKEIDENVSVVFSSTTYMTIDETEMCCTVYSRPDILKNVLKGRAPVYDNELMITENVSEEIGKRVGDKVTVSCGGGSAEYMITGIYQSVQDLGRCFTMSFEAASQLYDITPDIMHITLSDDSLADSTVKMLNETYGDILEAELTEQDGYSDSMTGLIDTLMNVITGVIYSVSAVFALVAVHMVCSKAFLRERRDSGIYKALGFTSGRLQLCFALRFLIISVIGGAIGTALSLMFSDRLLSLLLKNIGISCFDSKITAFTAAVPVLLICLCFFTFAYFSSGKIKRVEIRELVSE